MELAFNVSNLAWKSCHRNCLLWRSGPKWLDPKSSNLLESRLLRGREGNSLLVHALSHFFVFSLSFFLFLSLFSLLFFPCYFLTCFLFSLLFRSCFFLPLLPCTITIPFTNSLPRAPSAHFCLLAISYDTHGLPLGLFALFVDFLLFYRPMNHYSYHSGLMVFLFFPC